jgi:hypothetical protein
MHLLPLLLAKNKKGLAGRSSFFHECGRRAMPFYRLNAWATQHPWPVYFLFNIFLTP